MQWNQNFSVTLLHHGNVWTVSVHDLQTLLCELSLVSQWWCEEPNIVVCYVPSIEAVQLSASILGAQQIVYCLISQMLLIAHASNPPRITMVAVSLTVVTIYNFFPQLRNYLEKCYAVAPIYFLWLVNPANGSLFVLRLYRLKSL